MHACRISSPRQIILQTPSLRMAQSCRPWFEIGTASSPCTRPARTETSNAKEVYASRVSEPAAARQPQPPRTWSERRPVETPIQPSKRDDPMSIDPSNANQPEYMNAARVRQFGAIDAIHIEKIQRPAPAAGQVLVRVHAAGVGPRDAWVRTGQSKLGQPLPLTLGSDISGTVEAVAEASTDSYRATPSTAPPTPCSSVPTRNSPPRKPACLHASHVSSAMLKPPACPS